MMPEPPRYAQLHPDQQAKLDQAAADAMRAVTLLDERRPRFDNALNSIDALKTGQATLVADVAALKREVEGMAVLLRGSSSTQGISAYAKDPVVLFLIAVALGMLGLNPVEILK